MDQQPLALSATLENLQIEAFEVNEIRLQFLPHGPTKLTLLLIGKCFNRIPFGRCSLSFDALGHNALSQHDNLLWFETDQLRVHGEFPPKLVAIRSRNRNASDRLNPRFPSSRDYVLL